MDKVVLPKDELQRHVSRERVTDSQIASIASELEDVILEKLKEELAEFRAPIDWDGQDFAGMLDYNPYCDEFELVIFYADDPIGRYSIPFDATFGLGVSRWSTESGKLDAEAYELAAQNLEDLAARLREKAESA